MSGFGPELAEKWGLAINGALREAIQRLDQEAAVLDEALAREREAYRLLKKDYDEDVPRLREERDEAARELRVVRRDRDALVARAETAERTLENHGFDLRSMTRGEKDSSPPPKRTDPAVLEEKLRRELEARGLEQPPGRYQWRGGGGMVDPPSGPPTPFFHQGGSPPP